MLLFLALSYTGSSVAALESKPIAVAVSAYIGNLDPLRSTEANTQRINELLHIALVRTGPDLRPIADLAESFSFKNPLELDFVLKQNCKFSDGTPITAQTVKQSWQTFLDSSKKSTFRDALSRIKEIELLSNFRLKMKLAEPAPSLLSDLSVLKILHPQQSLLGAGPYKIVEQSGENLLLIPNPYSCVKSEQTSAPLPLLIKVVRDDLSRFLKLRTGELDMVLNELNYRKVDWVLQNKEPQLRAWTSNGLAFTYLGLNLRQRKLQDLRVRQALALSFDKEAIVRYKNRSMSSLSASILSSDNFYHNPTIPITNHDSAKAKQLLDQAGYYNTENNKPVLSLKFLTVNNPNVLENAFILVEQAKAVGIQLQHQSLEWGTFMSNVRAGNTDIYELRWVGATDPSIYAEVFHSSGKNNRTAFANSELDKLTELAEKTVAPKERRRLYWKVEEIVHRELPYISLWHGKNAAVYRKELLHVDIPHNASWRYLLNVRR